MPDARYLAFDLGAESGRALLASFNGERLGIEDLHRFPNEPVHAGEDLQWDVLRLWHELQHGLAAARSTGIAELDGVGLDAWGVDYALLGEGGTLVANPHHYRDTRTGGVVEEVLSIVPREEIYAATGIQFMQINTLYQLYAACKRTPGLIAAAKHFFTVPDLFNYWLTGEIACEYTNATTTQMFDPVRRDWSRPLLTRLGLPVGILTPTVEPGTVLGSLRTQLLAKSGLRSAPVIVPACHDTGSAVAAISLTGKSVFLSSGTWSLMGAEVAAPIITETARLLNFTNEGGVCGTTRLLKNIMGMWLLQGCRKCWSDLDYGTLVAMASPRPSLRSLVDPDDPSFFHPDDMTKAIAAFCTSTGQPAPEQPADFVQTILESLALKYRYVLECLEKLTGSRYDTIRVVGGGARNRALNQFTAEATGRTVVAGPIEATALGNIAMQLLATGRVGSLQEARKIIDNSFPVDVFEPVDPQPWQDAYERFRSRFLIGPDRNAGARAR